MQLNNLKKNKSNRKAKQVGRGGTRGKTSGRGTKGQNARSGRKKRPEMRDVIKRLPKLRGRGKNFLKTIKAKPVSVNLETLEKKFKAGDDVNLASLEKMGIIKREEGVLPKVKILGSGKISKKLNIDKINISATAKKAIEEAGGKVA